MKDYAFSAPSLRPMPCSSTAIRWPIAEDSRWKRPPSIDESRFASNDPIPSQRSCRGPGEAVSADSIINHWHYLEAVADRSLGNNLISKSDAADLAQQTCLEAYRDFHKFMGKTQAELKSWLRQIMINNIRSLARHYCHSSRRDVRREVSLSSSQAGPGPWLDLPEPDSAPDHLAVLEEELGHLRDALGRLPARMRDVLIWRSQDELTFRSLGKRLGCSSVSARKLWLKAMEALRNEMNALTTP